MAENHVIVAGYAAGGYTKTRPAFQYDYGQELQLQGFPEGMLPASFEMHFSIGMGQAITRIGTDGAVAVPNACLERFGTLTAWLFLHDTESDGETKYVIEIPVRSKAKTTDQEPMPEEQSVITEAIAALNAGVTAAEAAQEAAEAAAESVGEAAEQAQGKAGEAAASATAAAGSAEAAAGSATSAAGAATSAGESASAADGSATAASGSAEAAAGSAAAAAGSAAAAAQTVAGIEEAGAAQVLAVNTAGAAKVDAINTAGTEKVNAVNTAGAAQVQAVEAKGEEVIEEIPADYSALSADVTNLKSALSVLGKDLIHDNLLENAGLTSGKILQWSDGAVVDGDSKYYCTTTMIPCSVHDFPLYVVDKDMNVKSKAYQFFTYNINGSSSTKANNADVPLDVNRGQQSPYVANARITLDRTAFGDADENGVWAWVFTAQQYAKHVTANSVYLYQDTPVSSVSSNADIPRQLKSGIVNVTSLIDSGIMKRNTVNLLDKSIAYTGYSIDPRGYAYEDSSQSTATNKNYIIDCMNIQPNTEYAFTYGTWLISKAYWLDTDGNPISDVDLLQNDYVKTSPSGAYGVRCLILNLTSEKEVMICEGDTLPAYTDYEDGISINDEYIPGGGSEEVWEAIGNLNNLQTTAKDNLVSAINEAAQSGGGGGSGDGGRVLIHDNLLENVNLTSGKILQWSDGAVVSGAENYYCTTTMIPCSVHDFPLYVVDKDMTVKGKVYQFFTYNLDGSSATKANNADVPCDVNRTYQSAYVAFARFTLDRTAFGDADDAGVWAWVFTAQQYAKHVTAQSVYLYENASATRIAQNAEIYRSTKGTIANEQILGDSGIMQYKSRNLFAKVNAQNGYRLDPRGYPYENQGNYYVCDSMTIRPNTIYTFDIGTWLFNKAYWLDESGNPISMIFDVDSQTNTFTSPNNAYGVRCAITSHDASEFESKQYRFNEGSSLLDYDEFSTVRKFKDAYLPGFKHWGNYKYYSIGDSKTAGAGCSDRSKVYPKVIQEKTGIVNVNAAVDGAAFCQRTGITIPTMYEQAASVPLDTDIVTIFGGTNDRVVGVHSPNLNPVCTRGTMDHFASDSDKYDVTTFRGAVRQTIKNIKLRCPYAAIIFLVNSKVVSPDHDQSNDEYWYSTRSASWTDEAYDGGATIIDMINEVCLTYGIPVMDISRCAMSNRGGDEYLSSEYQPFADGLHESDFGNEMIARAVAGEMAKYLW